MIYFIIWNYFKRIVLVNWNVFVYENKCICRLIKSNSVIGNLYVIVFKGI